MKKFIAWLTINHSCNLNCKCCYQKLSKNRNIEMPLKTARELMEIFSELMVQKIILIGGEPTVHSSFFEILQCCENIEKTLVTNSLAFADADFCKRADDLGLSRVTTSFKGVNDNDYLSWTGKKAFNDVVSAIKNLENSNMDHQVSITVCRPVIEKWSEYLRVLPDLGASHYSFSFERPVCSEKEVIFDDAMMPEKITSFIENVMYDSLKDLGLSFDLNITFPQCFFRKGFVEKMISEGYAVSGCQFLMNNGIIVDPDGCIIPCNHLIFHQLAEYGKDFKNAKELLEWRQSVKITKFYEEAGSCTSRQCEDCSSWPICGAGCRMYWLYRGADELLPKQ